MVDWLTNIYWPEKFKAITYYKILKGDLITTPLLPPIPNTRYDNLSNHSSLHCNLDVPGTSSCVSYYSYVAI